MRSSRVRGAGPSRKPGTGLATLVLFLSAALSVLLAIHLNTAPSPKGGSATSRSFSALSAGKVLEHLMGDQVPHPVGSAANRAVRERILDRLRDLDFEPQIQERFVCGPFRRYCGHVVNVLARLEGASSDDALLLNSHYDTQPATPGGSDPMAGVASLLEIAGTLSSLPQPRNSVIFLFNDGEEAGLLGAQAFVEHHAWARQVRAVINLDARGTEGPSLAAYTIGEDRGLIGRFVRTGRVAASSSALLKLVGLLPNTNDLAVFDKLGIPGVLFGHAGNVRRYHTPGDNLENTSLASIQHMGENALGLTLDLIDGDLQSLSQGNSIFFSLGLVSIEWPVPWSVPLGAVSWILLLVSLVVHSKTGRLPLRSFSWAALGWPLTILFIFFASALLNWARKTMTSYSSAWVSVPEFTYFGFWLSAAALAIVAVSILRNRAGAWGWWSGIWFWWGAIGLALSVWQPAFSYLFALPTLMAGICGLAAHWTGDRRWDLPCFALPATLAALLWVPQLWTLEELIGIGNMPPLAALMGSALLPLAPLILLSGRWKQLLAASAVAGGLLVAIGTQLAPFSVERPQWANLIYFLDADGRSGSWIHTGHPLPPQIGERAEFQDWESLLPWSSQASGWVAEAPTLDLPAPTLVVQREDTERGKRRLVGRLFSPRGAPFIQMAFPSQDVPERIRLGGEMVPEDEAARPIFSTEFQVVTCWTVPPDGIEIELEFGDLSPKQVYLLDVSYQLPSEGNLLKASRPPTSAPVASGDATLVLSRLDL